MVQPVGRVADKVALVTGGASGLGAAAARLLAREGARVAITDLAEAEGTTVAAAIEATGGEAAGGEAMVLRHDVAVEADWQRVVAATMARWGRLDILVNSAGVASDNRLVVDTSLAEWRRVFSINLDGVFLGIRHCAPAMVAGGRGGSIINIGSVLGKVGFAHAGPYGAAKGAVTLLTRTAALELAAAAVRVNVIHPGFIETPLMTRGMAGLPDPAAARRRIEAAHPLGHLGEPVDIAEGVLFLASDAAKFMTGAELVIDGGYTAQ